MPSFSVLFSSYEKQITITKGRISNLCPGWTIEFESKPFHFCMRRRLVDRYNGEANMPKSLSGKLILYSEPSFKTLVSGLLSSGSAASYHRLTSSRHWACRRRRATTRVGVWESIALFSGWANQNQLSPMMSWSRFRARFDLPNLSPLDGQSCGRRQYYCHLDPSHLYDAKSQQTQSGY